MQWDNLVVTTGSPGKVIAADDYDAWGQVMDGRSFVEGSVDTRYKFTGKERDVETGYDYFGARYYDARIGRWLSVDPLAEKYPEASPYTYVHNNPIARFDPDGRDEFLLTWLPKGDAVGHSAVAIQQRDSKGNLTGNVTVRHLWPEGGAATVGKEYNADYRSEVIKESKLSDFKGGEGGGPDGIIRITGDAHQDAVMTSTLNGDQNAKPKYEVGKNDCASYAKGAVESVKIDGGAGAKVEIVGKTTGITYKSVNAVTPGSVHNAVASSGDSRVSVTKALPQRNGNPNIVIKPPDNEVIRQLKTN